MSIAEKLTAVAENQQEIEMQYFKTSFIGSGTTKASFAIPFMPDVVEILSLSPYITSNEYAYHSLVIDTRTAARWGSFVVFCTFAENGGSKLNIATIKAGSIHNGLFSYENGVFTWNVANQNFVFPQYSRYYVVAARFPNEDAKKIVVEEVSLLPDVVPEGSNGTLIYNKARINAIFTTDEWNALKATKPNWVFVLE